MVEAELASSRSSMGLPRARVVERLGDPGAPKSVSLIAIHQHQIPDHFSDEAIAEADTKSAALLDGREDLRMIPFITIDPADARDREDVYKRQPLQISSSRQDMPRLFAPHGVRTSWQLAVN